MSVDEVRLSYDLTARSHEADVQQAQYFQHLLKAEHSQLTQDLAKHSVRFGHAELANDHWRMQYERRQLQELEAEERVVARMLHAIASRFHGVTTD